jgi:hypothetical protein
MEQFLSRKWLVFNEGVDYNRILIRTNAVELRNRGKYLHKI